LVGKFVVPCGSELHEIGITTKGRLVPLQHGDMALVAALRRLGHVVPQCCNLAPLFEWQRELLANGQFRPQQRHPAPCLASVGDQPGAIDWYQEVCARRRRRAEQQRRVSYRVMPYLYTTGMSDDWAKRRAIASGLLGRMSCLCEDSLDGLIRFTWPGARGSVSSIHCSKSISLGCGPTVNPLITQQASLDIVCLVRSLPLYWYWRIFRRGWALVPEGIVLGFLGDGPTEARSNVSAYVLVRTCESDFRVIAVAVDLERCRAYPKEFPS
jgi:hypothetical protein